MEDPVDDLVFSKKLRTPKGKVTLFDQTSKFIKLPTPSSNSSFETGKELLTTQGATYVRTENIEKSIRKHDKDPAYAIKLYMDLFGLAYDQKFITKVLDESSVLILEQKNKFNRPRPEQLAVYFGIDLKVLNSKTNKSPSYPSGHSTQARLIAEIYAEKYSFHKANLLRAAEECGYARVMGGFHYPSDHLIGVHLAKRLFKTLKKKKKSLNYNTVFTLKQKNRE